jgi:hypothetical protein
MNPNSTEYLAFNTGFPNAFDRSLGRTGSFLMVHGGCRSVGCYAMTVHLINPKRGRFWNLPKHRPSKTDNKPGPLARLEEPQTQLAFNLLRDCRCDPLPMRARYDRREDSLQ